jgi:hypothetical protein
LNCHGFALAKQALFLLSHTSVHFALVILEMGGFTNYLLGLATNLDPPDLSFPVAKIKGISHPCPAIIYF